MSRLRHLILAIVVLACCIGELAARDFCAAPHTSAMIELVSPPYGGLPVSLRLSEYYASNGSFGTPRIAVIGDRIEITQTNGISWSQPSTICRVLTVTAGQLQPGHYRVTWTTTEDLFPRLEPPTRTRFIDLEFTLLPTQMIPAADDYILVLLVLTLAGVALSRLHA